MGEEIPISNTADRKSCQVTPTMAYSWKRMEGVGDWNGTGVDETVLLTSGPEKQP